MEKLWSWRLNSITWTQELMHLNRQSSQFKNNWEVLKIVTSSWMALCRWLKIRCPTLKYKLHNTVTNCQLTKTHMIGWSLGLVKFHTRQWRTKTRLPSRRPTYLMQGVKYLTWGQNPKIQNKSWNWQTLNLKNWRRQITENTRLLKSQFWMVKPNRNPLKLSSANWKKTTRIMLTILPDGRMISADLSWVTYSTSTRHWMNRQMKPKKGIWILIYWRRKSRCSKKNTEKTVLRERKALALWVMPLLIWLKKWQPMEKDMTQKSIKQKMTLQQMKMTLSNWQLCHRGQLMRSIHNLATLQILHRRMWKLTWT